MFKVENVSWGGALVDWRNDLRANASKIKIVTVCAACSRVFVKLCNLSIGSKLFVEVKSMESWIIHAARSKGDVQNTLWFVVILIKLLFLKIISDRLYYGILLYNFTAIIICTTVPNFKASAEFCYIILIMYSFYRNYICIYLYICKLILV